MLKTRDVAKKNDNLRRFTVDIFDRAKPELTILLKACNPNSAGKTQLTVQSAGR
jgi:hypothetical protein